MSDIPLFKLLAAYALKNAQPAAETAFRKIVKRFGWTAARAATETATEALIKGGVTKATKVGQDSANAEPVPSLADELTKLAALRDRGDLSPEEYEAAKRKIIET